MKLCGQVESGKCDFSHWMEKLKNYYKEKTGVALYPGTLNVRLEKHYNLPKKRIRLEKEEYGGTVSVSIVPCTINNYPAFILRTDKQDTEGDESKRLVEVAANIQFRDKFNLNDGDWVEIEVKNVKNTKEK